MNMKKIIAGVAASALTVSAMAVSAFAADTVLNASPWSKADTVEGNTITFTKAWAGSWIQFNEGETALLPESEWANSKIIVEVKLEQADLDAAIDPEDDGKPNSAAEVVLFKMGDTADESTALFAEEGKLEYRIELDPADRSTAEPGEDGSKYFGCNIQNGHVANSKITIYFETTSEAPGTSEAPATSDKEETTGTDAAGDTNKPTDDKNNAETGIEGVAIVAGLAVLAGGVVIVAKKRK